MNNLVILQENREALLLAEAVGWLHDYYKCSEELLQNESANGRNNNDCKELSTESGGLKELIINNEKALKTTMLSLPINGSLECDIHKLIHASFYKSSLGKPMFNKWNSKNDLLIQYLSRCHNTSHFDKQEPAGGKQFYPGTKISSPFGFERATPDNLTENLRNLPWNNLVDYDPKKREQLRKELENLFSQALGDTRRPINEIDLWSWGLLVGSLYKAALAGALLAGNAKDKNELKWRLLGVRFKGLDYILRVSRIPDMLARQDLLQNGLDRVRQLLEVTYPLGSEVYRDENGSVYVVPDLDDLLKMTDESGISLERLITNEFQKGALKDDPDLQIGGELQPHLELESEPWSGQDPKDFDKYQLPKIWSFLSPEPVSQPDPNVIKHFWQESKIADICTVCGLRPQGPGKKSTERSVCDICEKRRADRSRQWATASPEKTIWTEEVADINGRLALVAGQFHLTHWLDGAFLKSLFVIAPQNPDNTKGKDAAAKTPSFSRLRRIWETTRRFWQEVQDEVLKDIGGERPRLKIHLSAKPDLGDFHVYELALGPADLDVVWVPQGRDAGYLFSAANLGYIACRLGAEEAEYRRPVEAAHYVKNSLEKLFVQGACQPILRNQEIRSGRKSQNYLEGIAITEVACQEENQYAPVIPLLAEPRIFMMLVPAGSALRVIRGIKEKYEREMGKVRERMSLNLGIVYAGRRMPVRSLLKAGRAMLTSPRSPETWQVKKDENNKAKEEIEASAKGDLSALTLERDKRSVTWHLPHKMGDGSTEDHWYPYFYIEQEGSENSGDAGARREVESIMPLENGREKTCRLVHAADLKDGERIYLWPSTFDFEFLDTNARRFDVYYDQQGRRPRRTRPFYLEDLDRFDTLWGCLRYLSRTQRRQVVHTIEAAREDWYGQDAGGLALEDIVFSRFVADTLAGASWPRDKKWNDIPKIIQAELVKAGVRGELADLAELHMEILKE